MIDVGHIWLVDATTYSCHLPFDLRAAKERFFRTETYARARRFGRHAARGVRTYSPGLLRIATLLRTSGYSVRYLNLDEAATEFAALSRADAPAVIGFGAVCPTVPACAAFAEVVKERAPRTRVVLGGPHAVIAPILTRWRFPVFDDVVSEYDGEAAARLVGATRARLSPSPAYLNYELLPFPVEEYGLNLSTTTGCPFTCSYCQDNLAPTMRTELDGGLTALVPQLAPRTPVHFCDSVLGGSARRAQEVCAELAELAHGMLLSCDIRPELARPKLLELLQEAGFVEVRIGLDSADEEVLSYAGRSARPERLLHVLERIRSLSDLYISIYLVTGLPGTTSETVNRNLSIVQQLFELQLADQIKHHLYVPYPNDRLPKGDPRVRLRTTDWACYDRNSYPVFELENVSSEDLWTSFLQTERAINNAWAKNLQLNPDQIDAFGMYPDYNGVMYLGSLTGTAPSH